MHMSEKETIDLLELHDYADAVVHNLDPVARKRLTIGVELASRSGLLLFLDEPTSGLGRTEPAPKLDPRFAKTCRPGPSYPLHSTPTFFSTFREL